MVLLSCALAFLSVAGVALVANAAPPSCQVEQAEYRGWKSFKLSNGLVSLYVVPDIGGRAIQFQLDELKVITAVIVGGASLNGGKGTVLGAFLCCLLLATIRPAISFLNIGDHWEKAVVGAILLVAVLLDRIGRKS